jgi:hypothetical protein
MVTTGEATHVVEAEALPVMAGKGSTLQDMVMMGGQVIETCPVTIPTWAKVSQTDIANHVHLFFKREPWGLAPA